jgi:two-component system chemotaxis sensor kinase CheA
MARSILVIEDEELLQEAIKAKLEKDGYRVAGARMVDQAVDFLNTIGQVDAIWLDHYLPDYTGLDFLEAIRKNPAWAKIPVYLVTNTVNPEIINKYLALGIRQYYVKMLTKLETIVSKIEVDLQMGSG